MARNNARMPCRFQFSLGQAASLEKHMNLRFQSNLRSLLALTAICVFVFMPALTWISVGHTQHIERGGPGADDSWYAWTLPKDFELRIHRPRSVDFWKKWPIQVRESAAVYD